MQSAEERAAAFLLLGGFSLGGLGSRFLGLFFSRFFLGGLFLGSLFLGSFLLVLLGLRLSSWSLGCGLGRRFLNRVGKLGSRVGDGGALGLRLFMVGAGNLVEEVSKERRALRLGFLGRFRGGSLLLFLLGRFSRGFFFGRFYCGCYTTSALLFFYTVKKDNSPSAEDSAGAASVVAAGAGSAGVSVVSAGFSSSFFSSGFFSGSSFLWRREPKMLVRFLEWERLLGAAGGFCSAAGAGAGAGSSLVAGGSSLAAAGGSSLAASSPSLAGSSLGGSLEVSLDSAGLVAAGTTAGLPNQY